MSASQKEHKSEYKEFPQGLALLAAFQKKYAHIKAPTKPKEKIKLEEKTKPDEKEKKEEKAAPKKPEYKPISFQDLAWQQHKKLRQSKTRPEDQSATLPKAPKTLTEAEAGEIVGTFLRDRWRDLRKTGRPFLVRTGKKHTDLFKYFLHDESVKKSLAPEKLTLLRKALIDGDWDANIFKDKFLPQLTLSLFADKQITPWQAFTVLDRAQVLRQFNLISNYRIIDNNGEFTRAAKEIFIPALQNQNTLRALSKEELLLFRQLLFHLPKSEQYFYTTDLGPNNSLLLEYQLIKLANKPLPTDIQNLRSDQILFYFEGDELKYVTKKQTGEIVQDKITCGNEPNQLNQKHFNAFKNYAVGAISFSQFSYEYSSFVEVTRLRGHTSLSLKGIFISLLMQSDAIVPAHGMITTRTLLHLNFGAYDALGLSRFGLEHYIRTMPQLGLQTNQDTEGSVRQKLRLLALYYPGCRPFNEIHGNAGITYLEGTAHDRYHSNIMSCISGNILDALLRFVDLTRQFGFEWTREIYTWIDYELSYFAHNHKTPEKFNADPTTVLCNFLMHAMPITKYRTGGLLVLNGKITLPGVIIFLDMLDNPDAWKKLKIHPEKLSTPFIENYLNIKKVYPFIKNDNFKIRFIKCYCYLELENQNKTRNFSALFEMIDRNKHAFEKDFNFTKITKQQAANNPDIKNMLGGSINPKGPAKTFIEIILFYEYERSLKHLSNYSDNLFQNFVKAILIDNYSVDKALRFIEQRLNGAQEEAARFSVNWTSFFSPNSLKIVIPKAGASAADSKLDVPIPKTPVKSSS